jgi:SAM-dependent methyltransferase
MAHAGGGFDAAFFAGLAQREATNFWFRARNRLIVWVLRKYSPQLESMLEVGCGTGFVLSGVAQEFPQAALSGSEIFTDGLAFAAKRLPDARLVQMDARDIPFVDEFDVIGAFDVLEHIREDDQALTEIFGALKPGGTLLLAVPQHPWLWGPADVHAHHERRYTSRQLAQQVSDSGFEVLRTTSFVTLLLPFMAVSRWRQRRRQHYDPAAEFTISPVLNWVFERILAFERLGIQAGLNLPVGGSRLLIARKPVR